MNQHKKSEKSKKSLTNKQKHDRIQPVGRRAIKNSERWLSWSKAHDWKSCEH